MKIAFLTNIPSYYQIQLTNAFIEILGSENFRIIFSRPLDESRIEMGWKDDYIEDSIIRFWNSDSEKKEGQRWIYDADVVIQGRFPIDLVRDRINRGKLTFAYQERLWKKSFYRLDTLWRVFSLYRNYWSVNRGNYHFLAAGAYASSDIDKIGCFKNRRWKFGYFIDPSPFPKKNKIDKKIQLLWCGRLVDWKQPAVTLKIAENLKKQDIEFQLTIIGDGPEREKLNTLINSLQLDSCTQLLGWQTKSEIENHMQKADVFLMTSNRKEGWGVVINEAMAQGCCVISNSQAGATNWLIDEGQTGFIYNDQNLDKVTSIIAKLYSEKDFSYSIGRNANQTHNELWSTKIATNRLIDLSEGLLKNQNMQGHFESGPCSVDQE